MINRVVLVGRLTKDPELKYTPKGDAVANFTLAVNRNFSSASGEKETDFILCQVWRKQAENTANFLKKGSLAGVEGRIQTRNYEGSDGKRVYITEVIADSVQFLEPKSAQEGREGSGNTQQQGNQQRQPQGQQNQNNSYQNQQGSYQQQNNNNGYNAPPMGDPFNGGPIEVSDDDLPF